jgi:hypothetical protein
MKNYFFKAVFALCFITFLSSCDESESGLVSVFTEDVFFVGSDKVRVLGRVISSESLTILDHGFELSTSDQFSSPIRKSLGAKESPGRFISEVGDLDVNEKYFVRTYLETSEGQYIGNSVEIMTLTPGISDFSPKLSIESVEMVITGRNFTNDTRVFFDDVEANIVSIDFESRIRVTIPAIDKNVTPTIKVVSKGFEVSSPVNFEYIIGVFDKLNTFGSDIRLFENVSLQVGSDFIVGQGINQVFQHVNQFWRYNSSSDSWNTINFSGKSHRGAFSVNGFFGGGVFESARLDILDPRGLNFDLWRYQNGQFSIVSKFSFFSFGSRAFQIGDFLYVVGGAEERINRQVHRYSISKNTWETLAPSSFAIDYTMPSFTVGSLQYFIIADKSLVQYNHETQVWSKVGEYPGSNTLGNGIAKVFGSKVIIGLYTRSNEVFELDLNTLTWKSKTSWRGDNFFVNAGAYTLQNKIYVLRSKEIGSPGAGVMDFWTFSPFSF